MKPSVPPPMKGHQVLRVACQGCGASLQVDEGVRYVTCNYCSATLEILHDETVTHTRVLERLERRTEQVEEEVGILRLQNELLMLNQGWESYRQQMMIRQKDGSVREPSMAGAIVSGVLIVIVGLVAAGATSAMMGELGMVFALVFLGIGGFQLFHGVSRAQRYEDERARYRQRRSELEGRLRRLGRLQ